MVSSVACHLFRQHLLAAPEACWTQCALRITALYRSTLTSYLLTSASFRLCRRSVRRATRISFAPASAKR